jgi:GAF domain-containing protein
MQVGQTMAASLDLAQVLNAIAQYTAELLGAGVGVILLLDEASQSLAYHQSSI